MQRSFNKGTVANDHSGSSAIIRLMFRKSAAGLSFMDPEGDRILLLSPLRLLVLDPADPARDPALLPPPSPPPDLLSPLSC